MKAVATLTSSESRRLIAKAVVQMPSVQRAWEEAYVLLSDGSTNALIAQELLDDRGISPGKSTIGVSSHGRLCVNPPSQHGGFPNVFYQGTPSVGTSFAQALNDHHPDTVVIKGANALDAQGNVGIIMTGFDGGTIPRIIGPVLSKGLMMIVPVGLEKMIPSVPAAARAFNGAQNIDISLGASGGLFCLSQATVITEVEAVRILFQVEATPICCGGIGGNQGAVTLAFEGKEANIRALIQWLETDVKGEPPIEGVEPSCASCRYESCYYKQRRRNETMRENKKG